MTSTRTPRLLRSAVLLFVLLTAGATVSPAQVETHGAMIFVDEYYLCETPDATAGIRTFHVIHEYALVVSASRFKVETGPNVTMTYLSEVHPYPMTFGNTQDGITICYGACLGPIETPVVTMNYMAYGTPQVPCGRIHVVPHPDAETVEAMRCDGTAIRTYVRDMVVTPPGGSCGCPDAYVYPGTPHLIDCSALPVEPTTWGAIKALYRE